MWEEDLIYSTNLESLCPSFIHASFRSCEYSTILFPGGVPDILASEEGRSPVFIKTLSEMMIEITNRLCEVEIHKQKRASAGPRLVRGNVRPLYLLFGDISKCERAKECHHSHAAQPLRTRNASMHVSRLRYRCFFVLEYICFPPLHFVFLYRLNLEGV